MPDADVYQGDVLVAHLDRTRTGSRLTFVDDASLQHGFLATSLPREPIEGPDVPPFFLNLLPEGERLQLLLASARSKDDALGLLMRVGWDTIGDVAVLPHGETPGLHQAFAPASRLEDLDFWELFHSGASERPDHSIPGVQQKISASTVAFGVRTASIPSAILKLNPPKFPRLVQNEEFFLRMGRACGLDVNKASIVHDKTGEPGLLVTRFDRVKRGKSIVKLHQEDACQLLDIVPANKYNVPLRAIADAVAKVCSSRVVEGERLLRLVAFSYIIGNCDLHAKNISVIWDGVVRLTPAYDLLSTLPYTFLDRHMALKLQGKDDNFRREDFIEFGALYGIPALATSEMIANLCQRAEPWIPRFQEIGLDPKQTLFLQKEVKERIRRLMRTK